MSCFDTVNNPCGCGDPCNDSTTNCYDDCGCLNPTTFDCLTNPPPQVHLLVTADMNGAEVLTAINAAIGELKEDIQNIETPTSNLADVHVKVSSTDTTNGFLGAKIGEGKHIKKTILNPGNVEILNLSVNVPSMISKTSGNILTTDGNGLLYANVDGILPLPSLVEGEGIGLTGTGTTEDPIIISAKGFIQAKRTCFDGVWKEFLITTSSIPDVSWVAGKPKYRIRHDGSIEFKGNATYTVNFSEYSGSGFKFNLNVGVIPDNCVTLAEQNGIVNLKGMTFIENSEPTADQITQQYSYIIRKNSKNIELEFQSSFPSPVTKTVVVSFDGAIYHPNF